MKRHRMMIRAVLFLCLWFFAAGSAFAGGPVHGARAAAMGTAFNAVADDPSAILFNPAGLTQIKGTAVYGGVTALKPETEYMDPAGQKETTESQLFFPPNLYLSSDLDKKHFVFGIGLYSPFGIGGRKWSRTGLTRYASTENSIGTFSVNPTIAWQISPSVSLAAGVDYMRAETKMERMIDQSMAGAADASTSLEADGDGWGYNLGSLFFLDSDLRVALAYRSNIRVTSEGTITLDQIAPALQPLFGSSRFSTQARMVNRFPDIYSAGLAYQSTRALLVAFDVELVRWSSFKQVSIDVEQEVPAAGFGDTVAPLDWKDSWQYKAGIEYRTSDAWTIRAGYAYINTPVPDSSLEPGNPDAAQHNLSIGSGYRQDSWWIDWFYDLGLFKDRSVDNAILRGNYENIVHYLGINVGLHL